jgi:membrane fusion protein, multidrug efflux system
MAQASEPAKPIERLSSVFRLAGLALLPAVIGGCARPAPPQVESPPQVTVAEVLDREVTEWDEFTGRLEAVESVEVRPRVSGYVDAVRFIEGAIVRRGDLLFQIDPRPFEAETDRLRAELLRARATLQRADSELRRAERLRAEKAISGEEHERRAAFAKESAAQIAAVEAALRAAELNLEFTRVASPIDGRVSRAIVTKGNLVSSGAEATLLTTVVSLDPIYAYFDADEQIFLKYTAIATHGARSATRPTALPIRMALASDEGFPREGRTDFFDNRLDGDTGTIRVRAVFRNPDRTLTPGLFVRLRLAGTASYRGLLIQDAAVGTDLGKKFVFVIGPDRRIAYREVTLGPVIDGLRVVHTGLAPRDRVVVAGLQRVRAGVQAEPVVVAMDQAPAEGSVPTGGTQQ